MDYQFRPIERWPVATTPTSSRQISRFDSPYSQTISLLDRELRHLGAKQIVIQAYLRDCDIRNDGMIRANARPSEPGIIVSFGSQYGPLSYPCDTFTDWQDNLRAIALALEALRKVDRYGVTKRGEQYTGWAVLPSPNGDNWTEVEARRFIEGIVGNNVDWYEPYQSNAIRNAERKTHPDAGGNAAEFNKVQQARKLILG